MNECKAFVALVCFFLLAFAQEEMLAHAQDSAAASAAASSAANANAASTSGSNSQSGATATAPTSVANNSSTTNNTTTTINQNATTSHQFIGAIPGVTGQFTFGYPIDAEKWDYPRATFLTNLSLDGLKVLAKECHKTEIIQSVIEAGSETNAEPLAAPVVPASEEGKSVKQVNWWPLYGGYEDDQMLAHVMVTSKDRKATGLGCIAFALREALDKSHAHRVAIRTHDLNTGVVSGFSIGSGGSAARMTQPSKNNDPVAIAAGGILGRTTSRIDKYPQVEVIALNDGKYEAPKPPEVAQAPAQPQTLQLVWPKEPLVMQLSPVRLDMSSIPNPFPAQALQEKVRVETCDDLPPLTVLFDFDKAVVKKEYLPKIKGYVEWLAVHSQCQIQVEGHTCRSGSFDYDAALARRRAKAVYDTFIADGAKREQVTQFVSLSKDRLASEYEAPNRRVILRTIGHASGK